MHAHSFPISTAVRQPHEQDLYCETRIGALPEITASPPWFIASDVPVPGDLLQRLAQCPLVRALSHALHGSAGRFELHMITAEWNRRSE